VTDTNRDRAELLAEIDSLRAQVSDRERAEGQFEAIREERDTIIALLRHVSSIDCSNELLSVVSRLLQEWTDCEAVGIRLRDGDDFPYFETRGLSEDFVHTESRLCAEDEQGKVVRDSDGNPVLECMCGNVLCSRLDPSQPFFTEHGSFWTNSTTKLLASTSEADRQARTRNRCHGEGYESVALIPLRSGGETFGLLQLNDRREGRFVPERISLLERVADSFAMGLAHRRTLEALRESEGKYRQLFDTVSDAIMVLDAETKRFVDVNEATVSLYGYSREEFLGLTHSAITAEPEESTDSMEKLQRGELTRIPLRYHTKKDGTRFPVEIGASMFRLGGRLVLCGVVRDITERQLAEEALREAQRNLRSLFDTLGDFLFVLDAEGNVLHFNPVVESRLGYSADELRGMHVCDVHPPERREEAAAILVDLLAGRANACPLPLLCKDGTLIPVETKVSQGRWGGRDVLFGICRDTTERGRAQEALDARDAILEAVAFAGERLLADVPWEDGVRDMLARLGHAASVSRVYVFENEETEEGVFATTQRYEWAASGVASQMENSDCQTLPWRDGGMGRWESLLASGETVAGHVSAFPTNERRVLEPQDIKSIVAVPIEVWGQWWGFIGFDECQAEREWSTVEIEALKVAARVLAAAIERKDAQTKLLDHQERLRSLASELALAEERVRRRIATALHDRVGQTLALAKVKLGQLKEPAADLDQQIEDIRELVGSAFQDTRSLTFELSPPILYEVGLEAAIDWLADEIQQNHGIDVHFQGDGQPKPLDDDVRVVLYQAARELLFNVVKHANATSASVSVGLHGQRVQIVVSDNGQGIDIDKLPPDATAAHGFGLFSIRERLSLVGGHLDIESEIGQGTRVTIWAPLAKEAD